MRCSQCNAELTADDRFCGECGQPAPAASAPSPGPAPPPARIEDKPDVSPGVPRPPDQQGKYAAEISRNSPGCLLFLIDQSGSMEEPIAGGGGQPKKQVVADAVNRLLYNTVLRCAKEDGVRPYFDVGVWSYGGNNDVSRAFSADVVSIKEIAERSKRTEDRRRRVPDGAGGVYEEDFQMPIWFDPVAAGKTPMHAAFSAAAGPLKNWLGQHPASFPPIVIHLTDGAYTDKSPAPVVWDLMQTGTSDGNVLVFNCHISAEAGLALPFPDDQQAAGLQGLARELYDISSLLPAAMSRLAQAKGYRVGAGARGYAFNADQLTLIDFLDVGTRAVQDRMEKA